ncbi:7502_t:CDS:1, partial [Rhizophagus irregularis]
NWQFHDDYEKPSKKLFLKKTNFISNEDIKIDKEFIDADNADVDIIIPQESFSETRLHPGAIYSSRMMSFIDLSKSSQIKEIQRNMK